MKTRFSFLFICLLGVFVLFASSFSVPAQGGKGSRYPSLQSQLAEQYDGIAVAQGTELERLIMDNQQLSMLRDDEFGDVRGLPPWLRVWWRKGHPEAEYSAKDPTKGYPLVLKEILEWMMTHQDLKAGPGLEKDQYQLTDNEFVNALVGNNIRTSGAQTVARSESDIRVNYWDAQKILVASNNIGGTGQQGVYRSADGGVTWAQALIPLTSPDTSHSDPTVDWTSDGKGWSSTLGINGNSLRFRNYVSADNGATWTLDGTPSGTQTAVDKQMMWVDHSPTSPYYGQMYGIWHNNNPAFMNRRTAGAAGTWLAAPIQVSGAETSGTAIGDDVKTNSAGDVFGFWPASSGGKIFVVKSTNGGASYGTPVQIATTFDTYDTGIPSMNSRRALIYVSGGTYRTVSKNNVYASWGDLSGDSGCTAPANEPAANVASTCKTRIFFSRSTDGGATWSAKVKINNQAGLNDQFNQWMAVDETNGTIGIMYYDTVGDAGRKKTDIWFQSSTDDGVTWSAAQKVTTAMTDETVAGADSGNQYGDYNAMSGNANVFFPAWTDRRNAAHEEIWTAAITTSRRAAFADFDGDGKTDISIFRPGPGEWWYLKSSTGGNAAAQFGTSTDKLTPGDFTGDGKADLAFFRPSTGAWYVLRSEDNSFYSFPFGASTDIPVAADYDGDGKTDAAVFRPSTSTWYISNSSGGTTITTFGTAGDIPVAADYDGDGKADVAIYRPSLGQWWINRSASTTIAYAFGGSTDKCVPGDYTGDGKADVAFWRPSTGEWFVLRSEDNSFYSFPFGASTDAPSPGDYDGDGKMDAAVFRPSTSTWYVNRSTAGVLIQPFGTTGDISVPNANVR